MNKLYNANQVAEFLGVTRTSVYRWIKAGKLRAVKVGGLVRIKKKDLQEFIGKE